MLKSIDSATRLVISIGLVAVCVGSLSVAAAVDRSPAFAAAQTPPTPAPTGPSPSAPAGAGTPAAPASGQAGPGGSAPATPRIIGTMSELMVNIIYPTSDAILYISTRTPTNEVEWNRLQGEALMLAEAANLLMMPGRARDQDRWMQDAKLMLDAGAAAFKAAKARNVEALADLNEQVYVSCTTCHQHYRSNYGRGRAAAPR